MSVLLIYMVTAVLESLWTVNDTSPQFTTNIDNILFIDIDIVSLFFYEVCCIMS